MLPDILTKTEKRLAMVRHVARLTRVPAADILGPSRRHDVVRARWHAMTLIRAHFGDSYPKIARVFGRDHTTAMYGIASYLSPIPRLDYPNRRHRLGDVIGLGFWLGREQLAREAEKAISTDNALKHAARVARRARGEPCFADYHHAA